MFPNNKNEQNNGFLSSLILQKIKDCRSRCFRYFCQFFFFGATFFLSWLARFYNAKWTGNTEPICDSLIERYHKAIRCLEYL